MKTHKTKLAGELLDKAKRLFSQDEVNRIAATERRQGRASVLNELPRTVYLAQRCVRHEGCSELGIYDDVDTAKEACDLEAKTDSSFILPLKWFQRDRGWRADNDLDGFFWVSEWELNKQTK